MTTILQLGVYIYIYIYIYILFFNKVALSRTQVLSLLKRTAVRENIPFCHAFLEPFGLPITEITYCSLVTDAKFCIFLICKII